MSKKTTDKLASEIDDLQTQLDHTTKESIARGRKVDELGRETVSLREKVKRFENENQKLKEEIEKLRSLLLQAEKKAKAPLVRG